MFIPTDYPRDIREEAKKVLSKADYLKLGKALFPFGNYSNVSLEEWLECIDQETFVRNQAQEFVDLLTIADPLISCFADNLLAKEGALIPKEGEFVGYKLISLTCNPNNLLPRKRGSRYAIAELIIPEDAKRSQGVDYKCRCDKAFVKSITGYATWRWYSRDEDGKLVECAPQDGCRMSFLVYREDLNSRNEIKEGYSICRDKYKNINYRPGEWIKSDEWDNNRWNTCSHGIHFYLSIDRLFKERYIYVEREKELFCGYYNDFIKERER